MPSFSDPALRPRERTPGARAAGRKPDPTVSISYALDLPAAKMMASHKFSLEVQPETASHGKPGQARIIGLATQVRAAEQAEFTLAAHKAPSVNRLGNIAPCRCADRARLRHHAKCSGV